jgi:hypothetical protein
MLYHYSTHHPSSAIYVPRLEAELMKRLYRPDSTWNTYNVHDHHILSFIPDVEKYHQQSIALLHPSSRKHNIPHGEHANPFDGESQMEN